MAHVKAYQPEYGYRYQIFVRNLSYSREWEHCDYATDFTDKNHLLNNYRLAYGTQFQLKTILLPKKYHRIPNNKVNEKAS